MVTVLNEVQVETVINWESAIAGTIDSNGGFTESPKSIGRFTVIPGEITLAIKHADGTTSCIDVPISALRTALAAAT
jgi:hypothetical protein